MPKVDNDDPVLATIRSMTSAEKVAWWMTSRETARYGREKGLRKPWTTDPIIQEFRFCNVRRMDDRVSKWLMDNWYGPHQDHSMMLPAVAVARFVNLPRTLTHLTPVIFHRMSNKWNAGAVSETLRHVRDVINKGQPLWNAAYMVRGNDGLDKVASVVDHYVASLINPDGTPNNRLINTDSMRSTYRGVTELYGWGSFMAGQLVADLRWAMSGEWEDADTWAPPGPGSQRGLNRYFGEENLKKKYKEAEFNKRLAQMRAEVTPKVDSEITDRLEAHDWQNVMCEFDKWMRVVEGTSTPKQRYPGKSNG